MLHCNENVTAEKEKELDNKKNLTKKSNFDLTNFKFYEDDSEFWKDWNENQVKKSMSKSKLEELNQASKENRIIGY